MTRSFREELDTIRANGLMRSTRLITGRQERRVCCDGRDVLMMCSNNYLGLADHPELVAAAAAAVQRFGVSTAASRLVSGTMELHEQLETAVAGFKQTESALLFNSGYAANTGIIPALVGRGDVVFCDRLNHASIIDGIQLSGARLVRYRHNDLEHLEQQLKKHASGRCLIVTDGVFSMDGDTAPLGQLVELKQLYQALLMVDDAHGSGVLGKHGRGTAEECGVEGRIDILMGTFGKALGSYGAYAAVSRELRELLLNRARSFIFSTSLPPAVLAASLAALSIVQSPEGAALRLRLLDNTRIFRSGLKSGGFQVPDGTTQIVPLLCGDTEITMRFSRDLLEAGIFAQGIRPPTVPAGTSRVRFTMMASHTLDDLKQALEAVHKIGHRLGVV